MAGHSGGGHDTFVAAEVLFAATVIHSFSDLNSHAHFDPHSHVGHGPQHGDGYTNRAYRFVGGATGPNRPVQTTLPNRDGQVGLRVSCVMSLENFNPATQAFIDQLLVRVNRRLFQMWKGERWKLIGKRRMPRRFGLFVLTNAYMRGVNPNEPNQYFTHFDELKSLNVASEKPEDYVRPRGAEYDGAIGHTSRGLYQFGLVELDDLGNPRMVEHVVRNGRYDAKGNPRNLPGQRINPVKMFEYDRQVPTARVTMLMDTFRFARMVPAAKHGQEPEMQEMNVGGGEVNAFINCIPAAWYLNEATHTKGEPIQAMGEANFASQVMAEELFAMLEAHPLTQAEMDRRRFVEEHYNNGKRSIRNSIEPEPNTNDVSLTTGSQEVHEPGGYLAAIGLQSDPNAGQATRIPSGVVAPPDPYVKP